jgi:hypothetical protein
MGSSQSPSCDTVPLILAILQKNLLLLNTVLQKIVWKGNTALYSNSVLLRLCSKEKSRPQNNSLELLIYITAPLQDNKWGIRILK